MKKNIEFYGIIEDIIKNKEFIKLKDEPHHGISRLDHSFNVAKISYYIGKKLKVSNLEEITRAALLHDFFLDIDIKDGKNMLNHAKLAADNALKHFSIDKKQYRIIEAHMFPLNKKSPMYIGGWIVNISDKLSAIYEFTRYKAPLKAGIMSLFLFNLIISPISK